MSPEDVSAAPGVESSGSGISESEGKQPASVEEQEVGQHPEQPEDVKIRSADIPPGRVSDTSGKGEVDKHNEDRQRRQNLDEKLDAEVPTDGTGAPSEEESHPLISSKEDSGEKLHLEPPNRMEIKRNTIFRIRLLGVAWSGKTRSPLCAREEVVPNPRRGLYTEIDDWQLMRTRTNDQGNASCLQLLYSWEGSMECRMGIRRAYTHNHIVVGIMNRWTGVPREVLIEVRTAFFTFTFEWTTPGWVSAMVRSPSR